MGQEVHERIHHSRADGTPLPASECPVLRIRDTGEGVRLADERLHRPDGSSFPAQISARPMVDGLEVKGVVITFTDLSEIRETEEALRRAVRARDEVVAVVSHDL
ncbi:MAG: PAS domain S-box protein, partial [Gemmatimonadetes bacterium]|nr:PAS domain S-box protein [Gemmatimonadota bacterium]NIR81506.1 PAS domain S-box protein [Gemmatimonadota bacterium]NIT90351.1 PAS domain S-box protein [Gemmatimonadota bacterium]NIU34178.1 PAS domain S-box protein [Gemmatimonadota bacterium]NIU38324.1 PAS domain S-box protein [Gemmatimonadota bacterium]